MLHRERHALYRSTERCHYCSVLLCLPGTSLARENPRSVASYDHILPKSMPEHLRDSTLPQYVISCKFCNNLRGDMPYVVFKHFMDHRDTDKPAHLHAAFKRFKYNLMLSGFERMKEQT